MEYLGLSNQVDFVEGVFELLKKTELVKENKHYTKKDNTTIWEQKLFDTVQEACLNIIEAL